MLLEDLCMEGFVVINEAQPPNTMNNAHMSLRQREEDPEDEPASAAATTDAWSISQTTGSHTSDVWIIMSRA